jgi:hypothetical protein
MASDPEKLKRATTAIREIMDIFRVERYVYLGGAGAAMILLFYAAVLLIEGDGFNLENGALIFGSGGLFAVTGARTIILLQQSFALIRAILLENAKVKAGE